MNDLFWYVLGQYVLVFFDDILVYRPSIDHHYNHLDHVFTKRTQHHFYAKPAKYTFATDTIDYLGHLISAAGVQADPNKLTAIQQWPRPTNFTKFRGFLDLTGYYRCFVKIMTLLQ